MRRARSKTSSYFELLHIYARGFVTALIHAQVTLYKPEGDQPDRMARKKKKRKPFRAVTAVKELARERVGPPPAEKIVVEKKKRPEKHKPTLGKLLADL